MRQKKKSIPQEKKKNEQTKQIKSRADLFSGLFKTENKLVNFKFKWNLSWRKLNWVGVLGCMDLLKDKYNLERLSSE